MRAAILRGDRDIGLGEIADPEIRPGEVLLRTQHAGICGTDLHIFRGEFHDRVQYPAILGHELGGVIAELGRDVSGWSVGERVAVDPIIPCHGCPACLEGHINACRTLKLLGVDIAGGYGEYVAVPQQNLYRLPDKVRMEHAPMVEMYGLGHHILGRGRVQPGERVAIIGTGKLGLAVLDVLCHTASATETIVIDVAPVRLEIARRLGAQHLCNALEGDPVLEVMEATEGAGVDCVIECVGHHHEVPGRDAPLSQAVRMIRSGGRIVTAGLGAAPTTVPFKELVLKEAQIVASRVTAGEFPRAIRMMAKGLLHPELLVTHQSSLRDVSEAFARVDAESPEIIKTVLVLAD